MNTTVHCIVVQSRARGNSVLLTCSVPAPLLWVRVKMRATVVPRRRSEEMTLHLPSSIAREARLMRAAEASMDGTGCNSFGFYC